MKTKTKDHDASGEVKITRDVYQRVTSEIIAQLEAGHRPWIQPWSGGDLQQLRWNGKAYRGINTLLLWAASTSKGYRSRYWLTYRQAQEQGGNVRKGEKGSLVVYANHIRKPGQDDEKNTIWFMRGYTVFNAEQCDGLPDRFTKIEDESAKLAKLDNVNERAEALIERFADKIGYGGDKAAYIPDLDRVQMPKREAFTSIEGFYNTIFHELVHFSGHESRLNRQLKNRFGSEAYAAEELIAEMGAAFLAARLGVEPMIREDHAGYLASWLCALREDKRAIFTAAAAAERASEWLSPREDDEETIEDETTESE